MIKISSSAPAMALASAAALALSATPALARHRHHRDRIDGGDILAGVLILGGIAAVASAASRPGRDRDYRGSRDPDTGNPQAGYPDSRSPTDQDYRDWRSERDGASDYGAPRGGGEDAPGGADWGGAGEIDLAINACVGAVERGGRQVDSVEGVNRRGDGWLVEGRLRDGRAFSCTADADGRARGATVDGRVVV